MATKLDRWVKSRLRRHPGVFVRARGVRRWIRRLSRRVFPHDMWDRAVAGVETGQSQGWLDSQFVEDEYIRPQISGDSRVGYLQHFVNTYFADKPAERALSLGCGGGNLERALIDLRGASKIDAWDASEESIRLARQLAKEAGVGERIEYGVADINQLELPVGRYDFVIAKMSLHHFANLEGVYGQVRRALRPGGVFVFSEFVGPTQFQWTDLQLELANEALQTFADRQRTVPVITRPTVEEVVAEDPTESVRSAEVLPVLAEYFELIELKPFGGTLLNLLLTETLPAFDLDNPDHQAFLRLLFRFERRLIEHGTLPSDFAYGVARPRARN